jgi:hypothetical protein
MHISGVFDLFISGISSQTGVPGRLIPLGLFIASGLLAALLQTFIIKKLKLKRLQTKKELRNAPVLMKLNIEVLLFLLQKQHL